MAEKQQVNKTNEIVGLIYLLVAALFAVAYYIPSVNAGPLGRLLLNLGRGLVGPAAYVFPVLFLILSITTFLKVPLKRRKIRINHIFMLLILAASLSHAFTVEYKKIAELSFDESGNQTAFKAISVLWNASQKPEAFDSLAGTYPGGVIGGLIAAGLQRVTGHFGAIAILITASLAEAVVLGNFSIERILNGIGNFIKFIAFSLVDMIRAAGEALGDLSDSRSSEPQKAAEPLSEPPRLSRQKNKEAIKEYSLDSLRADAGQNEAAYGLETHFPSDSRNSGQPKRSLFSDVEEPSHSAKAPEPSYTIDGLDNPLADQSEPLKTNFKSPDFVIAPEIGRSDSSRPKKSIEQDFILRPADEKPNAGISAAKRDEPFKVKPVKERPAKFSAEGRMPTLNEKTAASETAESAKSAQSAETAKAKEGEEEAIVDLMEEAEADKPYEFPPLTLLEPRPVINSRSNAQRIHNMAQKLESTLDSFGVEAKVVHITTGPSITRFELRPGPGVKISRIVNLGDDIALSLAATAVRIEAPIPGKSAIGIEIPNTETAIVGLRALLENEDYKKRSEKLLVPLGRDIPGQPIYCDISKMPHLMIAGATGSGKSICINTILISLLYRCSPKELKLLLIDPKVVELSIYSGIPHLMAPVVTDPKKAANTLNWAVEEMNKRYKLFAERQVRDMKGYNADAEKEGYEKLPYIVLIIDELSDLMATAAHEVEEAISRLTAMARAAGIHLIIATQRPSVDVITGVIKANIPSRIAFAVSSQVDSRTILDGGGAEKLLGKGDMLYSPQSASKPKRGQGAFVSDHEVENVISFLKALKLRGYDKELAEKILSTPAPGVDTGGSNAEPEEDELLPEAVEVILDNGYASVSVLQRRLNIGYPRAGRLIDAMEMKGYIGPFEGSKPRKVILTRSDWALIQAQNEVGDEAEDENLGA